MTKSSEISPARHSARAPTNRSDVTATSTRAQSLFVGLRSGRHVVSSRGGAPLRLSPRLLSRPVAIPATVASRISGKALLVPVERVHRGTYGAQWRATTRLVPSPPKITMADTPTFAHGVNRLHRVAGGVPDGHLKELELRQGSASGGLTRCRGGPGRDCRRGRRRRASRRPSPTPIAPRPTIRR